MACRKRLPKYLAPGVHQHLILGLLSSLAEPPHLKPEFLQTLPQQPQDCISLMQSRLDIMQCHRYSSSRAWHPSCQSNDHSRICVKFIRYSSTSTRRQALVRCLGPGKLLVKPCKQGTMYVVLDLGAGTAGRRLLLGGLTRRRSCFPANRMLSLI